MGGPFVTRIVLQLSGLTQLFLIRHKHDPINQLTGR